MLDAHLPKLRQEFWTVRFTHHCIPCLRQLGKQVFHGQVGLGQRLDGRLLELREMGVLGDEQYRVIEHDVGE
jgi:hypothetical protein